MCKNSENHIEAKYECLYNHNHSLEKKAREKKRNLVKYLKEEWLQLWQCH